MFSISTGLLGRLASSLISGEVNVLEQMVVDKIEQMGENFIQEVVNSLLPSVGVEDRVRRVVSTGGASEFNRLRRRWLSSVTPRGPPVFSRIYRAFESAKSKVEARRRTQWGRSDWAGSRQDWLENKWRHDWRSQPRDRRGRWIEGRLNYVPSYLMYRGTKAGRTVRTMRKRRRARRAAIRRMTREIME